MHDATADPSSAFERLMLPHLGAAYNLARWLLRHEHDAEDAVQDAYIRAHHAFGSFTGDDGRAWLLKIVRNVCYSRLRLQSRRATSEAFDDEIHGASVDLGEANALAWREIKSALLNEALQRLTPEFREVIVLHEIEGLGYREIAEIIKTPIGTVMSRLARARQKLQREILVLGKESA